MNGMGFILAVVLMAIPGDTWVVSDQVVVYLAIIAGLCAVCFMCFLRSLQLEVALVVAVVAQLRTVVAHSLLQRYGNGKGATITGCVGVGMLLLGIIVVAVVAVRQMWGDEKRAQFLSDMDFERDVSVR